ncbi:MAG: PilX N-terminal domain-containing pilus assembly protein [Desulfitobacteriaceae bacterium]
MGNSCTRTYSINGFRESGFVTLLILLLMTTLSIYGMEGYIKANAQNLMAKREAQSRQAYYAAEGGIEWAKSQLVLNPAWRNGQVSLAGGPVIVTAELSEGGYQVTSTAHAGLAERKIQALFRVSSGQWTVLRYQELHR